MCGFARRRITCSLVWRSFIKEFDSPSKPKGNAYDATADGEKVQHFVAHMEQVFMSHPLWKGNVKEINDQAVEVRRCTLKIPIIINMKIHK